MALFLEMVSGCSLFVVIVRLCNVPGDCFTFKAVHCLVMISGYSLFVVISSGCTLFLLIVSNCALCAAIVSDCSPFLVMISGYALFLMVVSGYSLFVVIVSGHASFVVIVTGCAPRWTSTPWGRGLRHWRNWWPCFSKHLSRRARRTLQWVEAEQEQTHLFPFFLLSRHHDNALGNDYNTGFDTGVCQLYITTSVKTYSVKSPSVLVSIAVIMWGCSAVG